MAPSTGACWFERLKGNLALGLLCAIGFLAVQADGARAEATLGADATSQANASRYLIGRWSCTTFGGTHLTHEFRFARDLLLVNTHVMLAKNRAGTLRERYRYHDATSTWTVTLAKGKFVAQAPTWNDASWTFVGRMVENGKRVPSAMTYEKLADRAFRRDFKRRDGFGWSTYAGETCRRE